MSKPLILCLVILPGIVSSQDLALEWIELAGNKVVLHYKVEDPNKENRYLVNLFTSQDNFSAALAKVSGDVGTDVTPGDDKKIIWDITNELGPFKGKLAFEIRARVFVPFVRLPDFDEGKVFKRGKNYPVTWTSGNLGGQVNIELFQQDKRIWGENNIQNVGRFDWFIPTSVGRGSDYRLKFTNTRDRNEVAYTEEFTIKPRVPMVAKLGVLVLAGGGVAVALSAKTPTPDPIVEEPLPDNPGHP